MGNYKEPKLFFGMVQNLRFSYFGLCYKIKANETDKRSLPKS